MVFKAIKIAGHRVAIAAYNIKPSLRMHLLNGWDGILHPIQICSSSLLIFFINVGSPCGLPLFDHLRSIFLFHIVYITIIVRWGNSKLVDSNPLLLLSLLFVVSIFVPLAKLVSLFQSNQSPKEKTMIELGIPGIQTYDRPPP